MADVTIPIPDNPRERASWIKEISTSLDAGSDVIFVEAGDTTKKAKVYWINVDTDGDVKHQGEYTGYDACVCRYIAGGWHHIPGGVYKFHATGTDTSLSLVVKA